MKKMDYRLALDYIKKGELLVLPTDTIYGLLADALNEKAVEKIYLLKERERSKHLLLQVANIEDISIFVKNFSEYNKLKIQNIYNEYPTTIVFNDIYDKFNYLHNGTSTLGIRIPSVNDEYLKFLQKSGPVISTSANTAGQVNAKNIYEAKKYFGEKVSYYLDGGEIINNPSRVVQVDKDGNISKIIRA